MTADVQDYINSNMSSLKVLMDYLNYLKECIMNENFDYIYGIKVDDVNQLKLSMLSFLLSGNFDNIVEYSSANIKNDLINNVEYYRKNTGILNEDNKPLRVGAGLRIIKKPARLSDSDKIIKTIRDSIAHSKYVLVNDEIHIINRDFEALLTVSWLESMILTLFSNHSDNSHKKGASDYLITYLLNQDMIIKSETDLRKTIDSLLKVKFTFNQDVEHKNITMGLVQRLNLESFAALDRETTLIKRSSLPQKEKEQELIKAAKILLDYVKRDQDNVYDYKIERIDPTFIKEFRDYRNLIYGFESSYSMSQVIVDQYASFNDKEKRNIIAYKKMQEIIQVLSQDEVGLDYFFEKDHRLLYYIDMCFEIVFKSYMNLAFNYTKEQTALPYDFTSSNVKFILPNYVKNKIEEINKLKITLLNAKGQNITDITNKINKLNNLINEYKNKTLDVNYIYAEKMRNAIAHNNIKFNNTSNGYICTFEDYNDGILNFRATGTIDDFIRLAKNYNIIINNHVKTITK